MNFSDFSKKFQSPKPPKNFVELDENGNPVPKPKNNSFKAFLPIIALVLFVIIFNAFTYTVNETEHAIKFRFNEIIAVDVNNISDEQFLSLQNDSYYEGVTLKNGAGLRFKIPFIDRIEKFNNRLITYDTSPREVITSDKKVLILDNNAQWYIVDPIRFKVTMNSIYSASQRIEDLMYSKMNERIGLTTAHDLISNKTYVDNMLEQKATELNEITAEYGIVVADIQIKRTDYPDSNNENIFNRMRTEREQMAKQYRSEGLEEAQKIRAAADIEAAKITAEANAEAQRIRGAADAEAAQIYNDAYNADPSFYEFYKTLETYKATLPDNNTTIVISPDSDFAQFLFGAN